MKTPCWIQRWCVDPRYVGTSRPITFDEFDWPVWLSTNLTGGSVQALGSGKGVISLCHSQLMCCPNVHGNW